MREAVWETEIEKPGAWWHWRQERSILKKEGMVTTAMQLLGDEANCGQRSGHWMWWRGSHQWRQKERNQESGGKQNRRGWKKMWDQSKDLYVQEIYFGVPFLTINLQSYCTIIASLLVCLPQEAAGSMGVGTVSFTVFSDLSPTTMTGHSKRLNG